MNFGKILETNSDRKGTHATTGNRKGAQSITSGRVGS